ncbi:UDP-N-acetylglucosamine-dolichyl-phosphate N-acetylglucosaminephosphotransferase, putative [Bodo saltans]|uniref:UDP-N-acetylglucosamine--dolichyl-phosphate N-acetylglucosaminephosphotransferase n=1 Tax=Bodo saltans TaxID=75058 RepID=A0A0S4IKK6_BODSA|nr:UDP-N-acetylglucosamine-dolichyl-phosphate N-acetylglucosaminephosphotransferase, putative [Bodo saltans]|eukprot:CUE64812.1 UDP-N-acetylglucosamine-dolichyl-phosphate N-acetylglucosaminephosphotransferase, putative [Bodo saltans]
MEQEILHGIENSVRPISIAAVLSVIGYFVSMRFIPPVMQILFDRNIYGIDINKTTVETRQQFSKARKSGAEFSDTFKKLVVPESLGIVVGGIYLCAVLLALILAGVPLTKANGAVTTIAVMLLLGFVDDVLDVRWRYKLILSVFGAMPLIMGYEGALSVAVPIPLRDYIGSAFLYIGPLYLVYLVAVCVFCTNSINILAGVNGVEVGQSLVIGIASLVYNLVQLRHVDDQTTTEQHRVAIVLLLPFIGVSFALWKFNRYPSRVFVGDSYTYFAGTVLAVAGITAVYSKTLLLLFIPQIINFVISLPQLFHIIECPRHRVPRWIPERNVLTNSRNGTILNALLMVFGDMHERRLTNVVIVFQIVCSVLAFYIRYVLAGLVFERVV